MSDMTKTIQARSDQMNAEDFLSGPRTFMIEKTTVKDGDADQPVSIFMVGEDPKKPWKPCKTFRRVLVAVWGDASKSYAGKSLTLFRNPDVMFGGEKWGGIEISHMSGLSSPRVLRLTATRGRKREVTIQPLQGTEPVNALARQHAELKKTWFNKIGKDMEGDKEQKQEAFCMWVEETSLGQVLATDALVPTMYTEESIKHLMDALPN